MFQTITASELIKRSMYLINAVAAGETPDTVDLNGALLTLNEFLDSLSLSPLAMFASSNQSFNLVPGQSVYQWGETAPDFVSPRPVWVTNCTCIRKGVSTPVDIVTQEEYDMIPLKATPSPIIEKMLYVPESPNGVVTLFPVPTEAVTLSISAARQLTQPATLQTEIVLPPGYLRMLRYNLAVELWPEYANSTTDIKTVMGIAMKSMAVLKISNDRIPVARFDEVPGVEVGRGWDWRIG